MLDFKDILDNFNALKTDRGLTFCEAFNLKKDVEAIKEDVEFAERQYREALKSARETLTEWQERANANRPNIKSI